MVHIAGSNRSYLRGLCISFTEEVVRVPQFYGIYPDLRRAVHSDEPLSEEEKERFRNKVEEIKELRRSFGKSGITLLRPFITVKEADKWAMKNLLCK